MPRVKLIGIICKLIYTKSNTKKRLFAFVGKRALFLSMKFENCLVILFLDQLIAWVFLLFIFFATLTNVYAAKKPAIKRNMLTIQCIALGIRF